MSVSFVLSNDKLVFADEKGRRYAVSKSDKNFNAVCKAIKEKKSADDIVSILNVGINLKDVDLDPRVKFDGTNVTVDGKVLHNNVVSRLNDFVTLGLPIDHLLKFIENIEQNPSYNSRNQLYNFLEHSDIAITDDGCFIAYKSVRNDYWDKYTGKTFLNTVGTRVVMDRSQIDDNPNNHCSNGIHVGAWGYAGVGGWYNNASDRVMSVKVNPKDVVSVPSDHSCQKCRVCEYLVVGEIDKPLDIPLYTSDCKPYPVKEITPTDFEGFNYDDDDFDEEDIYTYEDEDDDYDSELDWDDEEDELDLPDEIEL